MLPDITALVQHGLTNAWIYLPLAVLIGALHALEPGHSKSMIAAFIIANKGTATQAVLLGVSAAFSHSLIVWLIAVIGLSLNDMLIFEKAAPYLHLASGVFILFLAAQMVGWLHFGHDHDHDHDHAHSHGDNPSHHHENTAFALHKDSKISNKQAVWFGFSGGLMPCPAAITILIICLQVKAFALGLSMVAAFSIGLALTLVAVGLAAVYGAKKAAEHGGFARFADKIPYIMGGLVALIGFSFLWKGFAAFAA